MIFRFDRSGAGGRRLVAYAAECGAAHGGHGRRAPVREGRDRGAHPEALQGARPSRLGAARAQVVVANKVARGGAGVPVVGAVTCS